MLARDCLSGLKIFLMGEPLFPKYDLPLYRPPSEAHSLNPTRSVIFRSNHASICLPLAGTLPGDRDRLLALIALARDNAPMLRPEPLRGL